MSSAKGRKNPDVLLEFENSTWSIAVKTSHGTSSPSIFANIKRGVEQIEESGTTGLVFINLKNLVNQQDQPQPIHFDSVTLATDAVKAQVLAVVQSLRSEIVLEDWQELFGVTNARPVVALMAQRTVSAVVPTGERRFVPVKVLWTLTAPPRTRILSELRGVDAAALRLLITLNEELQRNAGSKNELGATANIDATT